MTATTPSPLVSELGIERRIVVCAALALILLSLVFRNDRAMLLGPGTPVDRDASAFTAVVAPPIASGSISSFARYVPDARRPGRRAPVARTGSGTPATGPQFVAGAPETAPGAADPTPVFTVPVQTASAAGPARNYTPQMANFVGLPGGVVGSGGTTPTNPTDPTDPTDPTGPVDPTDPTDPVITPDPGPGAVPEPASWALMILGIGVVGASLRRRRASVPAQGLATA